jgi:plastocyanin
MRMITSCLVLTSAVVLAAGCGGSKNGAGSTAGGSATGSTITIVEKEFSLSPSSVSITKPGTYTIKGDNQGSFSHAIAIDGQGLDKTGPTVGPGQTSTITVDITKSGDYVLYCPVGNHRSQGMEGKLTLGASPAGAGAVTTTKDTSGGYGR